MKNYPGKHFKPLSPQSLKNQQVSFRDKIFPTGDGWQRSLLFFSFSWSIRSKFYSLAMSVANKICGIVSYSLTASLPGCFVFLYHPGFKIYYNDIAYVLSPFFKVGVWGSFKKAISDVNSERSFNVSRLNS
uniref:Uncharacterized protein n=1 Tax=candidate division WOR-3 bacterium TaxID=2052148 RepID=A0A7C6E9R2_UNCW3